MVSRKISATEAGLPYFELVELEKSANIFSLESHTRAKEALKRGLEMSEPGFNIFVVGEDRSGRMTATLAFLEEEMAKRPPPPDWLYLNNFSQENQPHAFPLPSGLGKVFKTRLNSLISQIREGLVYAFDQEKMQGIIKSQTEQLNADILEKLENLRSEAHDAGLEINQTQQGLFIVNSEKKAKANSESKNSSEEDGEGVNIRVQALEYKISQFTEWVTEEQIKIQQSSQSLGRKIADAAISMLVKDLKEEFSEIQSICDWLDELQMDATENFHLFLPPRNNQTNHPGYELPERRYAVNLFVDHNSSKHPKVILEANPTYQNLFGRLEYRQEGGGAETDFTMICPGALHRANGGVLVLRADALAGSDISWKFLKGAIRDETIQIEELHRFNGIPIAGAPKPQTIPLNLKVVIVGTPHWYYTFFSSDPEFKSYFKIKAEIDADMPASSNNLSRLGGIIQKMAHDRGGYTCSNSAVSELFSYASRWADDRTRVSSKFEQIDDLIAEAVTIAKQSGNVKQLGTADIQAARTARLRRNSRVEDRNQEMIQNGSVKIDLNGSVIGQVNGLTVRDVSDHTFGSPSRVTARTSIGRKGVVNIERDVALGGPIQQKAAMILNGYFLGTFARRTPLSFTASMTFEQNYGGVEGDSASLAEAVAIISDLAKMPVNQSLAITGSMNQLGVAQSVGGVRHKIEGFFRACEKSIAGLTGEQGVIVPASNKEQILLDQSVQDAISDGNFHIWTVENLADALELMLGAPAGEEEQDGSFPSETIFGRVQATLSMFNHQLILSERQGS